MADGAHPLLIALLAEAVPFETFAASRPRKTISSPGEAKPRPAMSEGEGDLAVGIAAVQYLLDNEELSIDGYGEWLRVCLAFKNSFGEAGFAPWLAFSEAAEGFTSEEKCRKQWDACKPRAEGAPLTIATYIALAKEAGWKPPRRKRKADDDAGGDEAGSSGKLPRGTDAGAHVVDLTIEAGDELWTDQDGKPHVTYLATLPDTREMARHAPVASEAYAAVLQQRFHDDVPNKVLTKDQLTLAVQLLGHKATEGGVEHVAALRVGEHDGRVYVDLGRADGAAAEVDGDGWRVVPAAPVRFVRGTRGELPDPTPGGTLADFERHFNLSSDDLLRLLGFLVGTFNVSGSYSILLTDGEQGSGKSTLNDKTVSLVDPPRQFKGARMAFTAKEQDLQIGALGVHVPYFDNVSSFSAEAADALCRLSTGGGSGARTLYTNTGYTEISVIRPIIVTSIGSPPSHIPEHCVRVS
ncbi:PriCT-2 domain-containing protein [Sphingomonas sp.]|uniref:PriCT-2 domain-containing protein n=1 Tax=Sphingomonas sp. TaxID=28214 RepID=UPI003AFF76BF